MILMQAMSHIEAEHEDRAEKRLVRIYNLQRERERERERERKII